MTTPLILGYDLALERLECHNYDFRWGVNQCWRKYQQNGLITHFSAPCQSYGCDHGARYFNVRLSRGFDYEYSRWKNSRKGCLKGWRKDPRPSIAGALFTDRPNKLSGNWWRPSGHRIVMLTTTRRALRFPATLSSSLAWSHLRWVRLLINECNEKQDHYNFDDLVSIRT